MKKILFLFTVIISAVYADDMNQKQASTIANPQNSENAQNRLWNVHISVDGIARNNMMNLRFTGFDAGVTSKVRASKYKIHPGVSIGWASKVGSSNVLVGIEGGMVFGFGKNSFAFTRDGRPTEVNLNAKYGHTLFYSGKLGYDFGTLASYVKFGQSFGTISLHADLPFGGGGERESRVEKIRKGILVGGGFEYKINAHFATALEYEHTFYKKVTFSNIDGGGAPILGSLKVRPQTAALKFRLIYKI